MGTYTEDHEPTEGKGGDENPRAIRCSVLEPLVPKKNGSLRFIQDLKLVNKVTIRNSKVGPVVDELEAFARRAIYTIGDLYSRDDQF